MQGAGYATWRSKGEDKGVCVCVAIGLEVYLLLGTGNRIVTILTGLCSSAKSRGR